MITDALARRADELAALGAPFVTATVVRAQRPTSVQPGNVALVLGDGTVEGFVGGVCAEHSVRLYGLKVLSSGEALLLKILPDAPSRAVGGDDEVVGEGEEIASEEGSVSVENPCLSGGAIEIFLEPRLPAPRVLVVGETPIARALTRLGPELELEVVGVDDRRPEPADGDLALVVAAHGRDELSALRRGLEAGLPYVALVASDKRGAALLAELRACGVAEELLERLVTPAGLKIGARTPAEIALSILAQIVAVRRSAAAPAPGARVDASAAPEMATDPICGMTVAAVADTPHLEHDGQTVYFCCEGCKARFQQERADVAAAG